MASAQRAAWCAASIQLQLPEDRLLACPRCGGYVGAMGMMMLTWLVILIVIGAVTLRLLVPRLPPGSSPDQDRRLAEQADQIERLEEELRQVREQADFTEKLISERGTPRGEETGEDRDRSSGAPPA